MPALFCEQSAIAGKDVVGLAQTGSGKTATFAIPIIQALLGNVQPFFALVLSPTRELAIQISEQFEALGSGVGLKCVALVGGIDMMQQAVALGKRPHVIVGTPGRVVDHIANTKGFSLKVGKYMPFAVVLAALVALRCCVGAALGCNACKVLHSSEQPERRTRVRPASPPPAQCASLMHAYLHASTAMVGWIADSASMAHRCNAAFWTSLRRHHHTAPHCLAHNCIIC